MRPNKEPVDLFIIGGGINGVGIAVDAAGRGLSVTLCEQGDLACATSSESSKLIHGGLRYLEYYEFRLVREALDEREILQKKAPHLIHSLPFIMPHNKKLKPAWMLRIGLFLYDHLAKHQKLPKSHAIHLQQHPAGQILKDDFTLGFSYSDCQVDDARLVILNALAAKQLGATILTHTRFISAQRYQDHWEINLESSLSGEKFSVLAKVLINAAGPWVEQIINQNLKFNVKNHVALIKGSHIAIPKLYPDHFAFTLVNSDNRVIFVMPYLDKYSLIGTTDIPFQGDPFSAKITTEEITYLCTAVNTYFKKSINSTDIIWTYAGVRALHSGKEANPSAISRDYVLELNTDQEQAPLLSVFGG
jgi:glycerol-3-phosphate dehydrogenase